MADAVPAPPKVNPFDPDRTIELDVNGYKLHVWHAEDGTTDVWLDTEVAEMDGICVSAESEPVKALTEAIEMFSAAERALLTYRHQLQERLAAAAQEARP